MSATAAGDVAIDANPVTHANPVGFVHGHHLTRTLVARDLLLTGALQILTVGTAYSGRSDAHNNVLISRLGPGHLIQRDTIVT
jgi:hypothetical protein